MDGKIVKLDKTGKSMNGCKKSSASVDVHLAETKNPDHLAQSVDSALSKITLYFKKTS